MPYKQTKTQCVVRLISLRGLSAAQLSQSQALRQEAGRLWTDLLTLHAQARAQGQWLSAGELEQATKGGQYALHSQSVQALCQKFSANVETATDLRRQELAATGRIQTDYPHHPKVYQTVIWKDQALTILPSGESASALRRPAATAAAADAGGVPGANLRRVEVTWRADHYELCLTLDTGDDAAASAARRGGRRGGSGRGPHRRRDHDAAACPRPLGTTVTRVQAMAQQGPQRAAGEAEPLPARISPRATLAQAQGAGERQGVSPATRPAASGGEESRGLLPERGRRRIAVGDVRDIQTGVSLGKRTNQKISQWPHGQFARYLSEKAARLGITVEWIDEAYSTRTCSVSGHVQPSSPRGRRFRCAGCGAQVHRDVNGSANICSKAVYGRYSQMQADTVKYLRPIGVAPWTRATSSWR